MSMIKKISCKDVLKAFCLGIGLNVVFSILLSLILSFLPENSPYLSSYTDTIGLITNFSFLVLIIKTGLLVPIFEEFIFRYIIFGTLLNRFSFKFSLIFSSALFALIHFSFIQFVYTFVLGLIFGFAYFKSKNFLIPVFIHVGINLSSVLFMILF